MNEQEFAVKYRHLIQSSPFGIFIYDQNEIIIDANDNFIIKEVLQTKKEDIIGKKISEMVTRFKNSQKILQLVDEIFSDNLENHQFKPTELEVIRNDGKVFWVNCHTSTINVREKIYFQTLIQDITESKNAMEELKKSEAKYKQLFENSAISIAIFDLEGKIVDLNSTLLEFLGYEREHLIGKDFLKLNLFKPEWVPILKKKLKLYVSGRKIKPIELQICKEDGTLSWLNPNASLVKIGDDTRIQIMFQDISEKKEAEQKLKESEEKFRTITEQSFMGIAILQDFEIKYVNKKMIDIFGYSAEEIKIWSPGEFLKIFHPDEVDMVKEQVRKKRLGQNGVIPSYEIRGIKKSGETIWLHDFSKSINYGGKTADLVTVLDITAKKEAEQKIKESEAKYRALFENSPHAIGLIDMKGKIIQCNSNVEKIFGYKPEEYLGKNFKDFLLFSKEHFNIILDSFKKLIKGEIPEQQEMQLIRKDGSIIGVQLQASLVKLANETLIQVITQDITEKKQAEQKLQESEKKYREAYNQVNFYKDLFAHDMNNILQNIISCEELTSLLEDDPGKVKKRKKYLSIIKEQVLRGKHLISNVQKLSQIEETEISLKKLDACNILEEEIFSIKKTFPLKKINVKISDGNSFQVQANELLHDVFANILINAIKYNNNQNIEILINISNETHDGVNYVKFEISDNGMGIPDIRKKIIFQRGYEEHKSGKGMGLGLSLVNKIIESYDGNIWVEDNVKGDWKNGSKFVILIPKAT